MTSPASFIVLRPDVHIVSAMDTLDFFACQKTSLARPITPLKAWAIVMSQPMPVLKAAFRVRDKISAWFGVKRIGGFSGKWPAQVKVGDMLDFFLVEHVSEKTLSLSARDRHLDVLTCISIDQNELSITSSVKTHNRFGRWYMLPVGPAHKMIVKVMLKRIQRRVLAEL